MPRFRFTLRRTMIWVAVAGLMMGFLLRLERQRLRMRRLGDEYLSRSLGASGESVKGTMKQILLLSRLRFRSPTMTPEEVAAIELEIRETTRQIEYYEGLQAKYNQALRDPLLPVAPDPPKPR